MIPTLPAGYRIVRHLGFGGLATVDLVIRERDQRYFALKRPLESVTLESFNKSAYRECSVTLSMRHPGVTRADLLIDSKQCYGVLTPYCSGANVASLACGDKQILAESPQALLNIFSAFSILLHYLELKGCVHGDFKPQNLFLPSGGIAAYSSSELFYARLIDFSMALLSGEPPQCRLGLGTFGYSAPETTHNGDVTFQSDIFSLGVVMYLLATGQHPFIKENADPAEISSAVREYNPPSAHDINPRIPEGLSRLIADAMAKESALRPANGFTICERLASLGATYPYQRAIRPRHLIGRHPDRDFCDLWSLKGLALPDPDRLFSLSGGNIEKIEMILEATFDQRALVWLDGELSAAQPFGGYCWPRRLRTTERKIFQTLPYSEAKDLVLCAVAGNCDKYVEVELARGRQPDYPGSRLALVELLRGEISAPTKIRESLRMAHDLYASPRRDNTKGLSAALFLAGRDLPRGAEATLEHCAELAANGREIEALGLLAKAQNLAEDIGEMERLSLLLHRDADIRKSVGDMTGAELRYQRIIDIGDGAPELTLAESYKDLGDIYKLKQDFDAGLSALAKAQVLYQRTDNIAELARVANNIGNIHWIRADYVAALRAYRGALRLHRKREDLSDISSTVNNIGSIYAATGRYRRGVQMYELSLAMKRRLGNKIEIARTLNNLGYTFHRVGDMTAALAHLREALTINRALGSRKEVLFNLDNLVACEMTSGRLRQAVALITEGRDIAEELHDHHTATAFDVLLAAIWKRHGRWRKAEEVFARSLDLSRRWQDRILEMTILLHWGDLFLRQNQNHAAQEKIKSARELAHDIGDRSAETAAIILDPNSDTNTLGRALEMASADDSRRDAAVAALACEERQKSSSLDDHTNPARLFFDSVEDDIELSRYWRLRAMGNRGDLSQRLIWAEDASTRARECGDKTEEWKCLVVAGDIFMQAMEYEKGYSSLVRSMKIVKELAAELQDKQSIQGFMAQSELRRMAELIATLKARVTSDPA